MVLYMPSEPMSPQAVARGFCPDGATAGAMYAVVGPRGDGSQMRYVTAPDTYEAAANKAYAALGGK